MIKGHDAPDACNKELRPVGPHAMGDEVLRTERLEAAGSGDELPPVPHRPRIVTPLEAVAIIALIVAALVSAMPLRSHFSNPSTYEHTINQLDEKRNIVMGLTAASTAASVAITAIPDDMGTPVADRLTDLAADLGIILIAIYLEKYLLTVFGFVAFGVLVPVACVLLIAAVIAHRRTGFWAALSGLAVKLLLMGAVLLVTVPASVGLTDMIERAYDLSITTEEVATEEITTEEPADEGTGNPFLDAWNYLTSLPGQVSEAVTSLPEELLDNINNLIDGFAVLIITSCLVPLGVLVFFIWVAGLISGIDVSGPLHALRPRTPDNVRSDVRAYRERVRGKAERVRSRKA